jgi:peptidoglycan hydrolase-like protein with peptidoglycan-binding domain
MDSGSDTDTEVTCEDLKNQKWSIGERSERVRRLQECMQDAGTFNWKYGATGYFGPVTQKALDDWKGQSSGGGGGTCEDLKNKNFSLGEVSQDVRSLQGCMRSAGYFTWPYGDTGYYGPVTKEAHAKYRGQDPNINYSCADLKGQVWVKGETSKRVRSLQKCMQDAGTFKWKYGPTGYFGPVTEEALIKWRGYF